MFRAIGPERERIIPRTQPLTRHEFELRVLVHLLPDEAGALVLSTCRQASRMPFALLPSDEPTPTARFAPDLLDRASLDNLRQRLRTELIEACRLLAAPGQPHLTHNWTVAVTAARLAQLYDALAWQLKSARQALEEVRWALLA